MTAAGTTALIAEARAWASKAVLVGRNVLRDLDRGVAYARRLADALEATLRDMHARELHHFEAEQAMREALELIQPGGFMRPDEPGYVGTTRDVVQARAILTRALNDKEAEK